MGVERAAVPAGTDPVPFQLCGGVCGDAVPCAMSLGCCRLRISSKAGPSVLEIQRLAAGAGRVHRIVLYIEL